jgi:hypothetical protein
VPIAQCIYVLENNLEKPLQLFLLLKHLYPEGKLKFTKEETSLLCLILDVNKKTIEANVKKLLELNWVRLNEKTNYYLLYSFDRIRKRECWDSRASIEFYPNDIFRVQAVLGAALYGYLHKDFWRKVKKEKNVLIKQRTYHFLFPSFNFKLEGAPVSVNGVKELFNISKAKASRIKNLAKKEKLISIEKTFQVIDISKFELEGLKQYSDAQTNSIVYRNGKYHLQGIDHIIPLFSIRKRKKLET